MSRVSKDLAGHSFGQLTAVRDSGDRDSSGGLIWVCECACGNIKRVSASNLKSGAVQSCGCLKEITNRLPRRKKPNEPCTVAGCTKSATEYGRTLCTTHAQRKRRYGDPLYVTPEHVRASRQRESILKTVTAKPNTYRKLNGRHEHRVVGERKAGRPLRIDEHVHHKDENKHNNHPDNLEVLSALEHLKLHAQMRSERAKSKAVSA
jgi:hypothetical protein